MTKQEIARTVCIMVGIYDEDHVAEIEKVKVKTLRLLLEKVSGLAISTRQEKELLIAEHEKQIRLLEEQQAHEIRQLRRRMQ